MDVSAVDGPLIELVHRMRQELVETSERSAAAEAVLEVERRERARLEQQLAATRRELAEARAVVYARLAGLHADEPADGRHADARRRSISELASRLQDDPRRQPPRDDRPPPRRRFRLF